MILRGVLRARRASAASASASAAARCCRRPPTADRARTACAAPHTRPHGAYHESTTRPRDALARRSRCLPGWRYARRARRLDHARVPLRRLRAGLRLHGAGRDRRREARPPPRVVECLRPGAHHVDDARRRRSLGARHRARRPGRRGVYAQRPWPEPAAAATRQRCWAESTPVDASAPPSTASPPRPAAGAPRLDRRPGLGALRRREHAVWKTLFERQTRLLPGPRLRRLRPGDGRPADRRRQIPDFRRLSEVLTARTGWQVVAVPGAGARRGVLRAPGEPALPGRQLHPQAARARLPRGARRLPRRVRPRADADATR